MRLKYVLAAVVICLMFANEGISGEYYQYTDKDGVVRFTDDPYMIPKNQRANVKTFESIETPQPEGSVESEPDDFTAEEESTEPGESPEFEPDDFTAEEESPESGLGVDTTPAGELRTNARELDAIRAELHKEFEEIQEEKEALGPPPPDSASTGEKADYTYKVTELNRKIDSYRQRSSEFQEKVDAFNSRITGK